jgi:hypothetical protein
MSCHISSRATIAKVCHQKANGNAWTWMEYLSLRYAIARGAPVPPTASLKDALT